MKVKVKKLHPNAVIPVYAKESDAGLDLTAVSHEYDHDGNLVYYTGLAIEIPEGYAGLLFPRSSVAKKELLLSNSVGVVDSGYRGEVMLKFKPAARFTFNLGTGEPYEFQAYEDGDRVGQLVIIPIPYVTLVEADELSTSERGEGGYGSSGK